jgi:hypothetical protein
VGDRSCMCLVLMVEIQAELNLKPTFKAAGVDFLFRKR